MLGMNGMAVLPGMNGMEAEVEALLQTTLAQMTSEGCQKETRRRMKQRLHRRRGRLSSCELN